MRWATLPDEASLQRPRLECVMLCTVVLVSLDEEAGHWWSRALSPSLSRHDIFADLFTPSDHLVVYASLLYVCQHCAVYSIVPRHLWSHHVTSARQSQECLVSSQRRWMCRPGTAFAVIPNARDP